MTRTDADEILNVIPRSLSAERSRSARTARATPNKRSAASASEQQMTSLPIVFDEAAGVHNVAHHAI